MFTTIFRNAKQSPPSSQYILGGCSAVGIVPPWDAGTIPAAINQGQLSRIAPEGLWDCGSTPEGLQEHLRGCGSISQSLPLPVVCAGGPTVTQKLWSSAWFTGEVWATQQQTKPILPGQECGIPAQCLIPRKPRGCVCLLEERCIGIQVKKLSILM